MLEIQRSLIGQFEVIKPGRVGLYKFITVNNSVDFEENWTYSHSAVKHSTINIVQ